MPHTCDARCTCPVHQTPLIYSVRLDLHACREATCQHAHGLQEGVQRVSQALGDLAAAVKDAEQKIAAFSAPTPSSLTVADLVSEIDRPLPVPGARRFRRQKRKSRLGVPGVRPKGPVPTLHGITVYSQAEDSE